MAERHSSLVQVVGGHFQRDLVAGKDANAELAHLSTGIGNQLMAVFQGDPKTRVREYFDHPAQHFDQFFFSHESPLDVAWRRGLIQLMAQYHVSPFGQGVVGCKQLSSELGNKAKNAVIFAASYRNCGDKAATFRGYMKRGDQVVANLLFGFFMQHARDGTRISACSRKIRKKCPVMDMRDADPKREGDLSGIRQRKSDHRRLRQ